MKPINPAIGILGGTFDPIHFGHLRSALELGQTLNLARVSLIPCYQPVHRKIPIASPEQRLNMLKLAIEHEPLLSIDDCEIVRKNPSYTIDTIEYLQQRYPNTPLCLIMGIDALLGFSSWYRYEDILEKAHLVIAHRPQYQLPQTGIIADLLHSRIKQQASILHTTLAGHIVLRPITALEISATDIRKQIAMGKNPRYLLPDNVLSYIQQHQVYDEKY